MSNNIHFGDRCVSYDTFIDDLSARIVYRLKAEAADPEFVSQNKAFKIFGRANVERWRKQGKAAAHKRPGKVEYRTADLRLLQQEQDFISSVF